MPTAVRAVRVVAEAHRAVVRRRHAVRRALVLAVLSAAFTAACMDGTYCQSGPKYGTQCYSVDTQPGNMPPSQNGGVYPVATKERKSPPPGKSP